MNRFHSFSFLSHPHSYFEKKGREFLRFIHPVIQQAVLAASLSLAVESSAQERLQKELFPNFDKRGTLSVQAAMKDTESMPVGIRVIRDSRLGGVRQVRAERGFLTHPNGVGVAVPLAMAERWNKDDPHRAVKALVEERKADFGFDATELGRV